MKIGLALFGGGARGIAHACAIQALEESDIIITIPSDGVGLLEAEKAEFCYESRYKTVIKNIKKIKRILDV